MKSNQFNKIKKNADKGAINTKVNKQHGLFAKTLKNILGGAYFESEQSFQTIPFLLFVALLAFLYITNNYFIENKTREIHKLQKEVKEYRYETITLKSDFMTLSRQSKLSGKLNKLGIKENTEPVKTITIYTKKKR